MGWKVVLGVLSWRGRPGGPPNPKVACCCCDSAGAAAWSVGAWWPTKEPCDV